jgi:hypothetical protein
MMSPMKGFARTAPSYESGYEADASLGKPAANKEGYVFPDCFILVMKLGFYFQKLG